MDIASIIRFGILLLSFFILNVNCDSYHYLSSPRTPFDPDTLDIRFDVIPQQVEYEARMGVTHILAVDGMGECSSLTFYERRSLAEIWTKHGRQYGLEVIIQVGSNSIRESVELALYAEQYGAYAISALPPYSPSRPENMDILIESLAQIANSVKIPFYYYHVPNITGLNYSMEEFLLKASSKIPTLKGIIYIDSNLTDFKACLDLPNPHYEKYQIFWASNPKNQSLPYNAVDFLLPESYTTSYLNKIVTSYYAGHFEDSYKAQERLNSLYSIIDRAEKDVFTMVGIPMGSSRLPNIPISSDIYNKVFHELIKFDFANLLEYGHVTIQGTSVYPNLSGDVYFVSTSQGVQVQIVLQGLLDHANQQIGIHVHEFGDISSSDGSSAGSHYVGSGSATHGCENSTVRSEGDMGNWNVDSQGRINQTKVLNLLQLSQNYSIIGRAVIVHNLTDNCINVSSAGARIGQGVIGIGNPTLYLHSDVPVINPANSTDGTVIKASCVLQGTTGHENIKGIVYFQQQNNRTQILARISGLQPTSIHGFHIHEFGDLSKSDGSASSGHYNPLQEQHALPLNTTRHIGDMGNILYYDVDGTAWYLFNNEKVKLFGENNVIGRTIIVHEKIDDGCTQPTGNAGSRYAQCVIGISPNIQIPSPPSNCCGNQTYSNCTPLNIVSSNLNGFPWSIVIIILSLFVFVLFVGIAIFFWKRKKQAYLVLNDP